MTDNNGNSKAMVLLSGGIDSTTCLALALREFDQVVGVSFDYSQRHLKEVEQASKICGHYNIQHRTIKYSFPKSMLTNPEQELPNASYDELSGVSPTYVPFRNGSFLANIAAQAQQESYDAIYFGAHAEDAADWAYPDCTPEFIGAMANAIYIGTYHQVRLHTPLQWFTKPQVVSLASQLKVPLNLTWSCYAGDELHCGTCPTCRSRKNAFIEADVSDPPIYQDKEDEKVPF